MVILIRGQVLGTEPREEAGFCMVGSPTIDLGEAEKRRGYSWLAEQAAWQCWVPREDGREGRSPRRMVFIDLSLLSIFPHPVFFD